MLGLFLLNLIVIKVKLFMDSVNKSNLLLLDLIKLNSLWIWVY